MSQPGGTILVVLKGYPRLSETFIAQEILGLQQAGLRLVIVSLRHPTDKYRHPIHERITAPVVYLPEYLYQEPLRVLRGLWRGWRQPGWWRALATWGRDLLRDPTPNRGRRFGQALVLAAELPADTVWLYAHFLHTPASVARYAALLTGLPWSVSAHAKDIWTSAEWEKREKLADCQWLVTCTASGADHLRTLSPDPGLVELVYHGLDFTRFAAFDRPGSGRDGSNSADPVRILSVGRLVAKKGTDDLLAALGQVRDLHWRLIHIGGGPLAADLRTQASALGIADRIEWLGAQPQDIVLAQYRAADLFVLASRIAEDGDRDGLPNVLMEAQSQALPCLSTAVSAIPELILADQTGLLVPPSDPPALAAALTRLIRDPDLRQRLGQAGCDRVRQDFTHDAGIARIAAKLCASPSTPR